MKCEQCNCAMRHDSTVCSNSSCSSRYVCDLCGSQRLTSEPLSAARVPKAKWPDTSGFTAGRNVSQAPRSRQVLEDAGTGSHRPTADEAGLVRNQPNLVIDRETREAGDPGADATGGYNRDIHTDYTYGPPGLHAHHLPGLALEDID